MEAARAPLGDHAFAFLLTVLSLARRMLPVASAGREIRRQAHSRSPGRVGLIRRLIAPRAINHARMTFPLCGAAAGSSPLPAAEPVHDPQASPRLIFRARFAHIPGLRRRHPTPPAGLPGPPAPGPPSIHSRTGGTRRLSNAPRSGAAPRPQRAGGNGGWAVRPTRDLGAVGVITNSVTDGQVMRRGTTRSAMDARWPGRRRDGEVLLVVWDAVAEVPDMGKAGAEDESGRGWGRALAQRPAVGLLPAARAALAEGHAGVD